MQTPSPQVVAIEAEEDDMDDDVPMVRLGDGVLGKMSIDSLSTSKRRRPRKRTKQVKILDDADMPSGEYASGRRLREARAKATRI